MGCREVLAPWLLMESSSRPSGLAARQGQGKESPMVSWPVPGDGEGSSQEGEALLLPLCCPPGFFRGPSETRAPTQRCSWHAALLHLGTSPTRLPCRLPTCQKMAWQRGLGICHTALNMLPLPFLLWPWRSRLPRAGGLPHQAPVQQAVNRLNVQLQRLLRLVLEAVGTGAALLREGGGVGRCGWAGELGAGSAHAATGGHCSPVLARRHPHTGHAAARDVAGTAVLLVWVAVRGLCMGHPRAPQLHREQSPGPDRGPVAGTPGQAWLLDWGTGARYPVL